MRSRQRSRGRGFAMTRPRSSRRPRSRRSWSAPGRSARGGTRHRRRALAAWGRGGDGASLPRPAPTRRGGIARPVPGGDGNGGCALASVEASVSIVFGYDIRGEISGERGTVALAETNRVVAKSGGRASAAIPGKERFVDAYDAEIAAWIRAAAAGGATGPSARDGYAAAVVCDVALDAVRTGEPVAVELAERPGGYG